MNRATVWFSRPLAACLVILASMLALACNDTTDEPTTAEVASALTQSIAQQRVDRCMTLYTTDTARKQCIGSAGFSLFDESGIETADKCIPGCICVQQEGCPCCDTGDFFGWVMWPRPNPGVWTPSAPTKQTVAIEIDRACTGTTQDRKSSLTLQTRSNSRLASLVDLEIAVPEAGIVAATVSDDGRYHDQTAGDHTLSGVAMLNATAQTGCVELGCHFGCEGDWVYPSTPEEGTCPAHEWWGVGCLKLTSCSFGCGTESEAPGTVVRPATNIFQLR